MAKVVLADLIEQTRAKDGIEIEAGGETFIIDPPQLWSDALVILAEAGDNLGLSKALLGGEEAYARFVAAGGSQAVIGLILADSTGGFGLPKPSRSSGSSKPTGRS